MHSGFLIEMLDACGKIDLHRTIDTSGFSDTDILLDVAKRTDLFLYDLKLMDSVLHKKWTGVGNKLILDNLKILAKTGVDINIRIPLILNVNADKSSLREMALFVSELPGKNTTVNLLPYHNIAENKYQKLGKKYNNHEMAEPSEEDQIMAVSIFRQYGVEAEIGG
jgi:pyruvate formate lyase activating enzyme